MKKCIKEGIEEGIEEGVEEGLREGLGGAVKKALEGERFQKAMRSRLMGFYKEGYMDGFKECLKKRREKNGRIK